jgi:hypothetical protein
MNITEIFSVKKNELLEAKRSKSFTFSKISYDRFTKLGASTNDYEETEINGYPVTAVYDGKNCIGLWYSKAKVASECLAFRGDAVSYSEQDPNWPHGD